MFPTTEIHSQVPPDMISPGDLSGSDGTDISGLEDALGVAVEDRVRRDGVSHVDDGELTVGGECRVKHDTVDRHECRTSVGSCVGKNGFPVDLEVADFGDVLAHDVVHLHEQIGSRLCH